MAEQSTERPSDSGVPGHWDHSLAGDPYTMVWVEATS